MKPVLVLVTCFFVNSCAFGNEVFQFSEINDQMCISVAACLHEKERFNASTIDAITQLYSQIVALPIPEILDLLEEIVSQFDDISTNHELNNSTLSWHKWIEKYWWMPPVIFAACIVLMLRYKKLSNRTIIGSIP